jgi:geranylgeranyl pyrophosphate synthase/predicted secreted hydrolase
MLSMASDGTADPRPVLLPHENTPATVSITKDAQNTVTGEPVHPENSIEWWFVQGSFQSAATGKRHFFMLGIFRYDISEAGMAPDDAYYVLVSLLDPATGRQTVISRTEHRVIDRFCDNNRALYSTGLDKALVETYIGELREYGPPAPIRLDAEKPVVECDPFSFSWTDLSFRSTDTGISLSFGMTGQDGQCRIHLIPQSPRYTMENIGSIPGRTMTYATRPRLTLSGHMGDDPVQGTAWFDHQWGNSGWFLSRPDGGDLYGWDWAGINGTDGSDWIFLTFRDPKSGTILNRFAALFRDGEPVRTFREFTLRPVRFWTSGKTHIRYPVAQEIEIPEISARFLLQPVTDDQEIPFLGSLRAVWEGAATVSGSVGTRPYSGTARLELQGYGYIFDFRQYIGSHVSRIQECIESFLPEDLGEDDFLRFTGTPSVVHDITACRETIIRPSWDLLARERKNWRPVFGMLLLETLGVSSEKYRMLLSVVPELTHTGTLIIDDIEDNASVRRGDTCIHRRYGTDVAINAANTLYFLPSVLYSTHPDLSDKQRLAFYRITHDSFIKGHFGQAQDIYWTKNLNNDTLAAWTNDRLGEKILRMYEFKTGSAAIATAEAGCILAGSEPEIRDACIAYARALGIAFQITDDIQSFAHDPGTGGMQGDDLAAGKMTYVIVRALELLEGPDRSRLRQILCSEHLRQDPQTLNEGIALVRKSGSLAECRTEALAMTDRAWRDFSRIVPPSEPKVMLRLFSQNLLDHPGNG